MWVVKFFQINNVLFLQKSESLIFQLDNSDFYGKNPSCAISKVHNSDF